MLKLPETLKAAIGRTVIAEDVVTAAPVAGLMAAFGADDPKPRAGDHLPLLWHGLFCTAKLPPARLAEDGLAKDEELLPAVPEFPNKLFGGARFEFRKPLRIGDRIRKSSEVVSFDTKEGNSGLFILGRVQHRISTSEGLAVIEENDIIFRPAGACPPMKRPGENPTTSAPLDPQWSVKLTPDPVLMFRHSALTFNSHRIHFDRDFAREKGYPGLLVQGTLIARLMLDMLTNRLPDFEVSAFSFRSRRPIYDNGDFNICAAPEGENVSLWVIDNSGHVGMTAHAAGAG
ncbi:MAG: MaoC family dehydratase N-terminal domain-containing protein [Pseudomonadota bacterium]|nr:MaoC family dehydratase N-terminal domain-containing protein [Pseudomonadota bacterium]